MHARTQQRPLKNGDAHVWRVPLSVPEAVFLELERLLHPDESKRSAAYHFADDRKRYIVSRGALRVVLSRYAHVGPESLRFGHGEQGKPYLIHPSLPDKIEFNLSHCGDLALIAFTRAGRVGIDVEKLMPVPELDRLLDMYFGEQERQFVQSARPDERVRAFLRLWTRREALSKALGTGLSEALCAGSAPPLGPGDIVQIERNGNWCLQDLRLDNDHVGAVCVEGDACTLVYLDYPEGLDPSPGTALG